MKKTILITGASRGIGAATALLAAEAGYRVCVNYAQNQTAAESIVRQIRSGGGEAVAIQADISSEAEVLRLFEATEQQLGPLTALVNNAGVLDLQARLSDMSLERWKRVFDVNATGTFLCSREAVRRMSTRNGGAGGAIVNVSSAASKHGAPNEYIDYAATKGAIDVMTIGLAKEVAAEGIRVNAVRPGLIYTEIHASSGEPGRVDRLRTVVPMQRGGQPEEVARTILWLLSGEASYITGVLLDVAGGR